jgi:hypothetical protein
MGLGVVQAHFLNNALITPFFTIGSFISRLVKQSIQKSP